MASKYDPAIDKGIALLDAKVPEWCTKMQLDHLKMGDGASCVLGQVFGDYDDGLIGLGLLDPAASGYPDDTVYGFDLDDGRGAFSNENYGPLTRRWKQRIRQHCEAHS